MSELLKFVGLEMQDISVLLVVATAIGFILIILASRFLGRIAPFRQHRKLVWVIDLVLLPILIVSIQLLLDKLMMAHGRPLIKDLDLFTETLLWLVGAWLFTRGLELFVWTTAFRKATGSECPRLLRGLVSIAIYLMALYGIVTFVFDREITGLLVSTGIIAGILGLAMQNVLSDLFAGLAITMEDPFRLGDWIELKDGTMGKVIDINWRTTRLLSWNNSIYVVPNNVAASSIIHNYDLPEKPYAYWCFVSIESEIPPTTVQQLLLEASLSCRAVLKSPLPTVRLADITTQPFKYMVYVYFPDYASHWAARSELYLAISSSLARSGISPSAVKYEIATRESLIPEIHEPTIEEYLRGLAVFRPLSDSEIEQLATTCTTKRFDAGDVLVQEGDTDSALFVIASGLVSVTKRDIRGYPVEVTRLGSSECIGEMSLLTGQPRFATTRAMTSVETIQVPKEGLAPLLELRPELSEQMAEIMAKRREKTESSIGSRTTPPAPGSMTAYAKEVVNSIRSFFSLE